MPSNHPLFFLNGLGLHVDFWFQEEVRREREAALRIQQAQKDGGAPVAIKTAIKVTKRKNPISQYSWSDGKKRVTVYVSHARMLKCTSAQMH